MVVWLVGMYASGKSDLANEIKQILEKEKHNVIVLNGGEIRQILGGDLSHSIEDRKINAERVSRVCKFLSDQGSIVICAMLSIFEETRQWNRDNIQNYFEVYLDVSIKVLLSRDKKNMYRKSLNGDIKNMVGVDIEFIPPKRPDLTLDNNKNRKNLIELAEKVVKNIPLDG
jgi:cytidine diphosphoramidate kinase